MGKSLFVSKNENKKIINIEELYNKGDFLEALKEVEHYLDLYPRDLKALYLKGKLFRMIKFNDKAASLFIKLFPYIRGNKEYEIKVLVELIYLEIYERNYLAAYSYLERLKKVAIFNSVKSLNIELAEVFLRHQIGMPVSSSSDRKESYFESQILNYNENALIKRMRSNNGINIKDGDFRRFDKDVDLTILLEQIKNIISIAKITPAYNVFDTYIFHYPNIGYDDTGALDYVQVLAYLRYDGEIKILEISPYRVHRYKSYINDLIDLEYQKMFLEETMERVREKKAF